MKIEIFADQVVELDEVSKNIDKVIEQLESVKKFIDVFGKNHSGDLNKIKIMTGIYTFDEIVKYIDSMINKLKEVSGMATCDPQEFLVVLGECCADSVDGIPFVG